MRIYVYKDDDGELFGVAHQIDTFNQADLEDVLDHRWISEDDLGDTLVLKNMEIEIKRRK